MTIRHKTFSLAAALGLGLLIAQPAPAVQAEEIFISTPFFTPGLVHQTDRVSPRYHYATPGHAYYYGPAPGYYFGSSDDNRRHYPPPRDYYRDRNRDYGPHYYYRDRERNRYYDPLDGRRYRQERYTPRYREDRYRRDTYKEHRIPKEGRTIQERRLPR